MAKRYGKIDPTRCVACGECAYVCPKKAATIVKGCYAAIDAAICVGCGLCETSCPAGCISFIEREDTTC